VATTAAPDLAAPPLERERDRAPADQVPEEASNVRAAPAPAARTAAPRPPPRPAPALAPPREADKPVAAAPPPAPTPTPARPKPVRRTDEFVDPWSK
jgi:hypothetical protein